MNQALETLTSANDEKVRCDVAAGPHWLRNVVTPHVCVQEQRIKELEESLTKCTAEQELVEGRCQLFLMFVFERVDAPHMNYYEQETLRSSF